MDKYIDLTLVDPQIPLPSNIIHVVNQDEMMGPGPLCAVEADSSARKEVETTL